MFAMRLRCYPGNLQAGNVACTSNIWIVEVGRHKPSRGIKIAFGTSLPDKLEILLNFLRAFLRECLLKMKHRPGHLAALLRAQT